MTKSILPSLGLRGRLVLLLVAAFSGLTSLAVWQSLEQRNSDTRHATERLQAEVGLIAARYETTVARADTLLNTLLMAPDFRDGRVPETCSDRFTQRQRLNPGLYEVGMATPDGVVRCTASQRHPGFNVGDRKWFQDALAHSGTVVGNVIVGRSLKRELIPIAKAMRDQSGQVRAVFFMAINLDWLRGELARHPLTPEQRITLLDGRGNVILRHPDPGGVTGTSISDHPFVQRLMAGTQAGTDEVDCLDGQRCLVAYVPFFQNAATSRYHLVLSQKTASIEAAMLRRLATGLTATLGLLLVTLLLLYWGSDRFVIGPLRRLAGTARRFGSGDLEAKSGLPERDDEIGDLARALEGMAHSLRETMVSHERLKAETELKQAAERQLHFSRGMLEQAGRIALVGTWSIDLRNPESFAANPVTWSAEMYRLMGQWPEDLPNPTWQDFIERIHPDDRAALTTVVIQALAERRDWRCVYRIVQPSGRTRSITEVGNFICDEKGNPVSVLGAAMDVTAQRRVSEELRDSVARLRLALAGANAGSYEWNVQTGESTWSAELWALFGLQPDPTGPTPDTWHAVAHPDDLERVERIIESAVANGEEFDLEWRICPADGSPPRWIMDRARPQRDENGKIVRYLGIAIDITERKQIEQSLERYREHLEEMVDERTASLVAARAEQKRLNRALRLLSDCNLLLARAEDEQGLLDDLCRLVVESGDYRLAWFGIAEHDDARSVRVGAQHGDHGGYLPTLAISWDGTLQTGNGPTGTAIRTGQTQVVQDFATDPRVALWRDTAERNGIRSSVALPIIDEGGIEGALTLYSVDSGRFSEEEINLLEEMARNVSYGLQALRARRELERYRKNLETLVAERTQEIGELNSALAQRAEEAEAANHAKGDFLATMSHEIRTPLNAVIGLTRLLADSPLDRRQRDFAGKIQGAAQALRTLIDDILDFSKIEAGALQLEAAPFSLDDVLGTVASVLSGGIGERQIEALFDIAPDIPDRLIGDQLRLQQVLLNLASNAIKFTENGAIVVAATLVAEENHQATLRFSVRDTGIGIPQDKLDTIFEVFTQADSSISRKYGGSGLGLAISARLVKAMGGRITVSSAVNWGTELQFTVTLGIDESTAETSPDIPSGLRILIVEDNPLARDILLRACRTVGWEANAAATGPAALTLLAEAGESSRHPDLLLVDWRMPHMDGLDMLQRARADERIALPLVLLMASANELAQAVAASDELTLDGVVTKPMTPASLYRAVARAWNGEPASFGVPAGLPDRRLAGLRLLVAEDNELNQEMVEQILTSAGATVTIAANGRIAVDLLRKAADLYDAVLMDIQMPVMDGYAATRTIREELGLTGLPIIAVTAHARSEDHERSRRAGMSGHIAKPVNVDELLDFLEHVGAPAVRPAPTGDAETSAVLDAAAGLRIFGQDGDTYRRLLQQFIDRHGGDAAKSASLHGDGRIEEAAALVHVLRGVAAYLQAPEVARLAGDCESALRSGEDAGALIVALDGALARLAESVGKFGAEPAASSSA